MQHSEGDQSAPRETAAGLQRDGKPPRHTRTGTSSKANPATQSNLVDDRSSPDEFSTRAKSQTGKHVTADKWNQ